jgi:hypothetical protein
MGLLYRLTLAIRTLIMFLDISIRDLALLGIRSLVPPTRSLFMAIRRPLLQQQPTHGPQPQPVPGIHQQSAQQDQQQSTLRMQQQFTSGNLQQQFTPGFQQQFTPGIQQQLAPDNQQHGQVYHQHFGQVHYYQANQYIQPQPHAHGFEVPGHPVGGPASQQPISNVTMSVPVHMAGGNVTGEGASAAAVEENNGHGAEAAENEGEGQAKEDEQEGAGRIMSEGFHGF